MSAMSWSRRASSACDETRSKIEEANDTSNKMKNSRQTVKNKVGRDAERDDVGWRDLTELLILKSSTLSLKRPRRVKAT